MVCFSFIFTTSFTLQEQVKGDRNTTIPLDKKCPLFAHTFLTDTLISSYCGNTCHNDFEVYNFLLKYYN